MKQIGCLLLLILCLSVWTYAADSDTSMETSGTICNTHCVIYGRDLSSCDSSCTVTSGEAVLINDAGEVKKIKNQEMCTSHMGKHVKMTAVPTEKDGEQWLQVKQLNDDAR